MTPEFRTALVARLIAVLSTSDRPWRELSDGRIDGPGSLSLTLDDTEHSPNHVDIGIELNRERPASPIIYDCVTGLGADATSAAQHAVEIWRQTSWATVQELMTQRGEFAEHFGHDDPMGLPGWHVMLSPIVGYGTDATVITELQNWLVDRGPIRSIAGSLAGELRRGPPHGVKIMIGGSEGSRTAEVRIDGVPSAPASAALRQLDWPTPDAFALVRCYGLFVDETPLPP
jgi:hypothetical protein